MIGAKNNTPAGRLRGLPEAVPVYTQAQWHERRRRGLVTLQVESFSAAREIADVAGPLAARIAALWAPLRFRRLVLAYADAAHEFVSGVIGWQAEVDGRTRTAHLEPGKRQYATTLIRDLAPRPELPEITDEMMIDGTWPAVLAALAVPLSAQRWAFSDRLEKLLDETVDRAALALERKVAWAESQPPPKPSSIPTATTDQQRRADLEAMGIRL